MKTLLSLTLRLQLKIRNLQSTIEVGDWGRVYGELLTFDDPESRLPAIDRLEGFCPGGVSLYRRVLVPIRTNEAELPAWHYVAGQKLEGGVARTSKNCW